ncbi:MAG: heme A synthase [Sphingobacteriales bacterium]|nr:MAG: heme A synthase [Sphingobacteriales bacterium]
MNAHENRSPSFPETSTTESLPVDTPVRVRTTRPVANWLLLGVGMLVIQILLGGITRLTGSGLSITQWKPILGAVPPLNETDWSAAFRKYQSIAQYKYLNSDFTLSDFKAIYFWEWMHREWARLMGLVFLVGFAIFCYQKRLTKAMIGPFIILFVLGALQGAIGWIMVASGLNDTDLYVSHIRLAVHFIAALVLIGYTFWFYLKLRIPETARTEQPRLRRILLILLGLLTIQLVYGAFMAGLKASTAAPTWPGINGQLLPVNPAQYGNRIFTGLQWMTDHPLVVHFIHRSLALLLCLGVLGFTIAAAGVKNRIKAPALSHWYKWPLLLVLVQAILGILTVLNATKATNSRMGAYEWLAEAHQLVAMSLLLSLLALLFATRQRTAVVR